MNTIIRMLQCAIQKYNNSAETRYELFAKTFFAINQGYNCSYLLKISDNQHLENYAINVSK